MQPQLCDCAPFNELLYLLRHPLHTEELHILDQQLGHRLITDPDEEVQQEGDQIIAPCNTTDPDCYYILQPHHFQPLHDPPEGTR